ncbi:MAG: transcription antitermination factor NusB [Mariprofundaceae bacterium]|nr:transcription antitermination factor NusB [Mariprofundaceae bacterium]
MNQTTSPTGSNRHLARESALEVLYAWQSSECDDGAIPSLIAGRMDEEDRQHQDVEYMRLMVHGVIEQCETLDANISTVIKRSLRSIATLELNILRLSTWEMTTRLEIPYKVIINEALELARDYADESARGFINGVLDQLAKQLRRAEIDSKK